MWRGTCLLGAVAVGGAYVYQPVPPVDRLLGKSVEYVNFYTDAYKARIRRLQLVAATKGAVGGSAVFFLIRHAQHKAVVRLCYPVDTVERRG